MSNYEIIDRHTDKDAQLRLLDVHNEEEFQKWLEVRQDFVERQGWKPPESVDQHDLDRYDLDEAQTCHIVVEEGDRIIAGMRLTPCESPGETLSWSMLSPEIQEKARLNLPPDAQGINSYDITRLVSAEGVDHNTARAATFEVLGAAMALSSQEGSPEAGARWYFTTSVPFLHFLRRQGINFTEIARGVITPGDRYKSVFCYTDPMEQAHNLREKAHDFQENLDAITRGFNSIAETRVG